MSRPEPSRHIRKNLDRLIKIEEAKRREAERIRQEEEQKWRDLQYAWQAIAGYINRWGLQAFTDAMEDLRPHYVIGDIVRNIFKEVSEAGYRASVISGGSPQSPSAGRRGKWKAGAACSVFTSTVAAGNSWGTRRRSLMGTLYLPRPS